MQDFRRLKVWEKAYAFMLAVHRATESFPTQNGTALIGQLQRAALSIPANIAEGATKGSDGEFRRFLRISMGSAAETEQHLLLARDTGCLDSAAHERLSSQGAEVRRMLGGLIKRLNADLESPRVKRDEAGGSRRSR